MTIGDRIRKAREARNLTQEELANIMGYVSKTSISKVETSKNDITLKNIEKYAKALGVSITYLMGMEMDYSFSYTQQKPKKATEKLPKGYNELDSQNKSKVNDYIKTLLFYQENH